MLLITKSRGICHVDGAMTVTVELRTVRVGSCFKCGALRRLFED